MKKTHYVLVIAVLCITASLPAIAQYTPVPGPNFAGCQNMGAGSQPYAPKPLFNPSVIGSPVSYPPPGSYDFCAYADTAYCSLNIPLLLGLAPEVAEFADLVQCRFMDINGPINEAAEIPIQPNGMLDGQYELGIVAHVLNTVSHPLHAETTAAFQDNFQIIKDLVCEALLNTTLKAEDDKNLIPLVQSLAPHLISTLSAVLAGFATLGDETTNAALDELISLLSDIGVEPPEGGVNAIATGIPQLGPFGNADGDKFSNYAEYQYFVGELNYTAAQFISAVFDPNQHPPILDPAVSLTTKTGFNRVGDTITLETTVKNYYELPESVEWFKNGILIEEESDLNLVLLNAQESDSGLYKVVVTILAEEDKAIEVELTDTLVLTVGEFDLPAGGGLGLLAIASACALAGALGLRKRK